MKFTSWWTHGTLVLQRTSNKSESYGSSFYSLSLDIDLTIHFRNADKNLVKKMNEHIAMMNREMGAKIFAVVLYTNKAGQICRAV